MLIEFAILLLNVNNKLYDGDDLMNSFYSLEELKKLGFKSIGAGCNDNDLDVLLSKKASIYGIENISIGNHIRIDDFCILSGNVTIGNYVHIAAYCALFGGKSGIEIKDFSGVSSRTAIYAESDDYSGKALSNPTVPYEYRDVQGGKVVLEKHSIIGTGSTILPGVCVGEGTAVGSMSLVNKSLESWTIYIGIPCHKIKDRDKNLINLELKVIGKEK